ncbi:uncharacterized protein KGF55_000385 [Candida pseudojiufengensis]|uniref:uncharacterized protein n=1 Tax=Candida pseudojiufengensis TaxID=497109 RepID=UPI0022244FE8|nr:uncharacterized protein KGF55_000385 [Candida pseudojiufengensis]KAI5966976.1 hypothetical protein KGF55_000385 [Candida pseudojiufengensis]
MENEYDSINLASTVRSQFINTASDDQPKFNLMMSEEEDENEYELDPEEFISSKEEDKKEEPMLMESISSILDSVIQPPTENQNFNEPIKHLTTRIEILQNELRKKASLYSENLNSGDNINELRDDIVRIFHQLSECHYSLNELYSKDATYTQSIAEYFKTWDLKREKILKKIKHIKSGQSQYGSKVIKLIKESQSLDDEIDTLEQKLLMMKKKKQLLNQEIENANSIIESRISTYIEGYKNLENNGQDLLHNYLQNSGIPETQIATLIDKTPIDISFSIPTKLIGKSNDTTDEQVKETGMGIQPYDPTLHTSNEATDMNHDHGPTAYEKGYMRGSQNSTQLKHQFQTIIGKLVNSPNVSSSKGSNIKLNEHSNNVLSSSNLESVRAYLLHRHQALNDQVITTTQKAFTFNEYDKLWTKVRHILKSQEDNFEMVLSKSTTDGDKTSLLTILDSTKNQLEKLNQEAGGELITKLIHDEIDAITKGIQLIKEESKQISKSKKYN